MPISRLYLQLDRIEAKIDDLDSRVDSVDKTLVSQHEQLVMHIKRTELLELALDPVKAHVEQIRGAGKLLAIIVALAAIAEAFIAYWKH